MKTRRQKKLGVSKMLAQTESWRRRRRISLLLGSAESAAADFSQAPLKISYFSLMMVLLSVHAVVKWSIASTCPAFTAGLSPVQYWLVVPAHYAENVQNFGANKNIGGCLNSLIFAKLCSLYLCLQASYQKVVKTQMLTITVQHHFLYSQPPNQRLS